LLPGAEPAGGKTGDGRRAQHAAPHADGARQRRVLNRKDLTEVFKTWKSYVTFAKSVP
jgi:hypothetical protein